MNREQFKNAAAAVVCVLLGNALVFLFFVCLFTPDRV